MSAAQIFDVVEREETNIPASELWVEGKLAILPEVLNRGFFQIRLTRENLIIYAGQYIGLIPLNERVVINVQPKVSVPRLMDVLGRAEAKIRVLASFMVGYQPATYRPLALLQPIASTLVRQLQRLQGMGLLKTYLPSTSDYGPLRGRILFDRSLRRFWSKGLQHRASTSFYDLTPDIPPNQVLKSAVDHLLRQFRYFPKKPASLMNDLGSYQELFALLSIREIDSSQLRSAHWQSLPEPYREAVELASLIVQGRGIQLPAGGHVKLPSFLIDMAEVFESYIRQVMKTGLVPMCQVLDGNKEGARSLYDDKPMPLATPDIVVTRAGGVRLIADTKYKDAPSREDVNQIVTYAVRYGVKKVLLVCLSSEVTGQLERLGTISGIEVHRYGFSISAPDLDIEESRMIGAVLNDIVAN